MTTAVQLSLQWRSRTASRTSRRLTAAAGKPSCHQCNLLYMVQQSKAFTFFL